MTVPGSMEGFPLERPVSLFEGPPVARPVMRPAVAALVAAAVLCLVAAPAAARFGFPEPLTERGREVEEIYAKIAVAGILVFVLVFALLVWVLARYREGSGHGKATHERHRGSIKAELVWTILPLIVMLWIGVMSYAGLVKLDAELGSDDYDMEVHVVGRQWLWEMRYTENVTVTVTASADAHGALTFSDTFHLPEDTRILLNLTGGDVIHAFNLVDANRAYVLMDDANPSGPHKYHEQVVSLPVGKYLIQCKEMCLNPGHGYMRAELVVETRAQFDEWLADRELCGAAPLCDFVDVTAKSGALTYADPAAAFAVEGTRVAVKATNAGPGELTINGLGAEVKVPVGATYRQAVDIEGDQKLNVSFSPITKAKESSFTVEGVVPDEEIAVDLADYKILPPSLDLKVGTKYLVKATNLGGTSHNLFFGTYGGEVLASSNTAGKNQEALLYFAPTQAGTIDMWCDVPGHEGLGMRGTVNIR